MSGMTDHVCMNILYKDLSSPHFKEYYTLDEINQELREIEGSEIEPHNGQGEVLTNVTFHMSYSSFSQTLNPVFEADGEEAIADRIYRFMEMSLVKQ